MNLIKNVTIKNFRSIREEQKIDLLQGTYIVGGNNSGKTTFLQAVNFYFSSELPRDESFLNKSEFIARQAGYNKCEITLCFDLKAMISKVKKDRLIKAYGEICKIKKSVAFREAKKICV